jgi:hypothetical protein
MSFYHANRRNDRYIGNKCKIICNERKARFQQLLLSRQDSRYYTYLHKSTPINNEHTPRYITNKLSKNIKTE